MLDPLDDSLVEGASETVRLALQDPSVGELASPAEFTATLTDIHTASIAFATRGSTTPDESSGARSVVLELDCGPNVTLGVAASVLVSDLRAGSAVAGGDYSFVAKTLTFPAGKVDGAIKTVNVQVVDDGALEGDETVTLGLSTPSATCILGANVAHELTIHDDDLVAEAAPRPWIWVYLASPAATRTTSRWKSRARAPSPWRRAPARRWR